MTYYHDTTIQHAIQNWVDIGQWHAPFAVTLTLKQRVWLENGYVSLTSDLAKRNLRHFLNIVNNLQERPSQIISTGVGLKNIQNRYLLLNNTKPSFEKTETQFIAKVPLVLLDSNPLNN